MPTKTPTYQTLSLERGESVQVKACYMCKVEKSVDDFWKNQAACKKCQYEYRKANPERSNHAAWRYGLNKIGVTPERYYEMFDEQNGVCAICSRPSRNSKKLAVDHCHATGRVRGLLCQSCNVALGLFQDDPARLHVAAEYLTAQIG